MNVSLARSALAVAAFALLASAGAGATTRAVRPPAASEHANPSGAFLTPHIGMRVVQKKPDAKCKFDACGELYAKTSSDYLEYEWCAGYGSDPCSGLYSGSVQWYADAYTKKNGTYYPEIVNFLESESSSGSEGQGVSGNPVYQYSTDNGAKVTNGKYKYVDYVFAYWGSENPQEILIGIGVYR